MTIAADWQDDEYYRQLAGIDRAELAWEWMRRDPEYRAFCTQKRSVVVQTLGSSNMIASAPLVADLWGAHFR